MKPFTSCFVTQLLWSNDGWLWKEICWVWVYLSLGKNIYVNKTYYIREPRPSWKVDISAFVQLETIGYGECAAGSLECLKKLKLPLARFIWCCVSSERTDHWQIGEEEP